MNWAIFTIAIGFVLFFSLYFVWYLIVIWQVARLSCSLGISEFVTIHHSSRCYFTSTACQKWARLIEYYLTHLDQRKHNYIYSMTEIFSSSIYIYFSALDNINLGSGLGGIGEKMEIKVDHLIHCRASDLYKDSYGCRVKMCGVLQRYNKMAYFTCLGRQQKVCPLCRSETHARGPSQKITIHTLTMTQTYTHADRES